MKNLFKKAVGVRMKYPTEMKVPAPEELSIGNWYAFTLNPNDLYQITSFDQDSVNNFNEDMRHLFSGISSSTHFLVWLEFSKKGRFHWHGIIRVNDPIDFYLLDLPHLIAYSNIDLDTIRDMPEWLMYCQKNRQLMERLWDKNIFINSYISSVTLYNPTNVLNERPAEPSEDPKLKESSRRAVPACD
nr:rep protein [Cressdnaviricota sp.]UOF79567.1 rep protein [Cressdnaviricota sp.]